MATDVSKLTFEQLQALRPDLVRQVREACEADLATCTLAQLELARPDLVEAARKGYRPAKAIAEGLREDGTDFPSRRGSQAAA